MWMTGNEFSNNLNEGSLFSLSLKAGYELVVGFGIECGDVREVVRCWS